MPKHILVGNGPASGMRYDLSPLESGMKTGGEGNVYFPDNKTCIKIFHNPNECEGQLANVKRVLSSGLYSKVQSYSTVPQALVWDKRLIGYTMERLDGWHSLNEILTKADSKNLGVDLKSTGMILTALSRAIRLIHYHGFVIGDLNPRNIMFRQVNKQFLVKVIDVDSWSVYRKDIHLEYASSILDTSIIYYPDVIKADRENKSWPRFTRDHDWWAFAYLCWMVLTKHDPFTTGKISDADKEDRILGKHTVNNAATVQMHCEYGPDIQAMGPKLRLYLDRCLKQRVRNRPFPTSILAEFAYNLRTCKCGFTTHASAVICSCCARLL